VTYTIDTTHASPNASSRGGAPIRLLVWHATVGDYDSSLAWLCSPASKVSTHYLIRKDGHTAQLVPDNRAAWHAGNSAWMGLDRLAIQRQSIGVELENANDGHDPYPPAQIGAAHFLGQLLVARYNIERADVVRHLDIALPKGRKTDPAGLPWPLFADSLYLDSTPPPPTRGRAYRVRLAATAGAVIRSGPRQNAAKLGVLAPGERWQGVAVVGQLIAVPGFGSSAQWVRSSDMRFVWGGLLEET